MSSRFQMKLVPRATRSLPSGAESYRSHRIDMIVFSLSSPSVSPVSKLSVSSWSSVSWYDVSPMFGMFSDAVFISLSAETAKYVGQPSPKANRVPMLLP